MGDLSNRTCDEHVPMGDLRKRTCDEHVPMGDLRNRTCDEHVPIGDLRKRTCDEHVPMGDLRNRIMGLSVLQCTGYTQKIYRLTAVTKISWEHSTTFSPLNTEPILLGSSQRRSIKIAGWRERGDMYTHG